MELDISFSRKALCQLSLQIRLYRQTLRWLIGRCGYSWYEAGIQICDWRDWENHKYLQPSKLVFGRNYVVLKEFVSSSAWRGSCATRWASVGCRRLIWDKTTTDNPSRRKNAELQRSGCKSYAMTWTISALPSRTWRWHLRGSTSLSK